MTILGMIVPENIVIEEGIHRALFPKKNEVTNSYSHSTFAQKNDSLLASCF